MTSPSRRRSVLRERALARLIRKVLIEVFGHKCALCGRRRARWHLDHPRGRIWKVRSCSRLTRMRRYLEDFLEGNLRLLCHSCNESDGAKRLWAAKRKNIY